ncbi:hypothetical protein LCGC14_3145950, partial [marine sediment metagenome]
MPDAWTYECWAKYSSGTVFPLFAFAANSQQPAVYLYFASSRPIIFMGNTNFRYFSLTDPVSIIDGEWHHLVYRLPGAAQADISSSTL